MSSLSSPNFFQPVYSLGNGLKDRVYNATEWYFDLSLNGKKFSVLTPLNKSSHHLITPSKAKPGSKLFTFMKNTFKVLSYFTVIFPLMALSLKTLFRNAYAFRVIRPATPPKPARVFEKVVTKPKEASEPAIESSTPKKENAESSTNTKTSSPKMKRSYADVVNQSLLKNSGNKNNSPTGAHQEPIPSEDNSSKSPGIDPVIPSTQLMVKPKKNPLPHGLKRSITSAILSRLPNPKRVISFYPPFASSKPIVSIDPTLLETVDLSSFISQTQMGYVAMPKPQKAQPVILKSQPSPSTPLLMPATPKVESSEPEEEYYHPTFEDATFSHRESEMKKVLSLLEEYKAIDPAGYKQLLPTLEKMYADCGGEPSLAELTSLKVKLFHLISQKAAMAEVINLKKADLVMKAEENALKKRQIEVLESNKEGLCSKVFKVVVVGIALFAFLCVLADRLQPPRIVHRFHPT